MLLVGKKAFVYVGYAYEMHIAQVQGSCSAFCNIFVFTLELDLTTPIFSQLCN
jgi:hypothetical protein